MKELWIEIEKSVPLKIKKVLIEVAKKYCSVILSDKTDASLVKKQGVRFASSEGGDILMIDESRINDIGTSPKPLCFRLVVKDREDEDKAIKVAEMGVEYIAVSCPDWKIIPLENLIAKIHGTAKLLAEVSNSEEARVALDVLELGVNGIILRTTDVNEVKLTINAISNLENKIELIPAKIIRSKQLDMGSRVCIDTCDIMIPGEGLLVGCGSSGLFLVEAEVRESPHVEPRPFRVNAGPISLYILVPGNNTRYLSELGAGDEVLIVDRAGRSRKAIIGRIKIERRPMMLIEAIVSKDKVKTIVQNAETIRLVTKEGSKSVPELKQGDEVLVCHQRGGRHFGILVEEETIIER